MADEFWEIDDVEEEEDDEEGVSIASIQASWRAVWEVIQRHNLGNEVQELYEKYLPEENLKQQEWLAKVSERSDKT